MPFDLAAAVMLESNLDLHVMTRSGFEYLIGDRLIERVRLRLQGLIPKEFTSADVDANANTIAIHPGISPFEFGQQVIYRQNDLPDDYDPAEHPDYVPEIPGLIHNHQRPSRQPGSSPQRGPTRLGDARMARDGHRRPPRS